MLITVPLSDVASEALVAELQRRGGFRIQADDGRGWMRPSDASRKIGRHDNWLGKLLHRGVKPPGLEAEYSRNGRLIQVRMAPEFHAWAKARFEPQPELAI